MRCSATNSRGEPCGVPALRGSSPPLCNFHSLTVEQRYERAVNANRAGGRSRPRTRFTSEPSAHEGEIISLDPEPVHPVEDPAPSPHRDPYGFPRDLETRIRRRRFQDAGWLR
jgi:hypothetical protein